MVVTILFSYKIFSYLSMINDLNETAYIHSIHTLGFNSNSIHCTPLLIHTITKTPNLP